MLNGSSSGRILPVGRFFSRSKTARKAPLTGDRQGANATVGPGRLISSRNHLRDGLVPSTCVGNNGQNFTLDQWHESPVDSNPFCRSRTVRKNTIVRKRLSSLTLKAPDMQYKTIILELLQQHPRIRDQLRRQRRLLAAVNHLASDLKSRHEAWKARLRQANPGRSQRQIACEALEIALQETADRLSADSQPSGRHPLSLDEAMAFLRRPMPNE